MNFEPVKLWTPDHDIWDQCNKNLDYIPPIASVFTADLLDYKTGERVMQGVAPNTVLNRAYEAILSGAHPKFSFNWIEVGTSNTPVAAGQNGIIAPLNGGRADGLTSNGPYTSRIDGAAGSYQWAYIAYWPGRFANGDLREVAITGQFFGTLNRALFKNVNGEELVIPKDSSHVLRVTVQVRFTYNRA